MLKNTTEKTDFFERKKKVLSIEIPSSLVTKAIIFFIEQKQKHLSIDGFSGEKIPPQYIKEHYTSSLKTHIEKIFYSFYVKDIAFKLLREKGMYIQKFLMFICNFSFDTLEMTYTYEYSGKLLDSDVIPDFKKLKFPSRKKYRDLDKQAKLIINNENKNKECYSNSPIGEGDWVGIKVYLSDGESIFDENFYVKLWINITSENIDREIRNVFVGKKVKDSFFSNAFFLNDYLSTDFLNHIFFIVIDSHISSLYFCIDSFKSSFKYDNKDVFERLVELFSLRRDISLRREKSQMSLRYFLERVKIFFDGDVVGEHEFVLKTQVVKSPDYLLYQADENFIKNIRRLACAQTMEKILIDYLIYKFHFKSTPCLLYSYFNILQRHRIKDFLYFDFAHINDNLYKSIPIHNCVIEQAALREKMIDFLIKKSTI